MRSVPMDRSLLRHALFLAAAVLWLTAAPALASPLDDAKAAGHVGEGPDGYAHLVDPGSTPGDIAALVSEINGKRRAAYQRIADREGIPLEAVAAQAGAKLIDRAPPGSRVRNADGTWRVK